MPQPNSPAPPTSSTTARRRPSRIPSRWWWTTSPACCARIAGLFSGRGYNIESLTVSETEHEKHLSRFTIVTTGTPQVLTQIKSQLERLVNVHRVVDLTVLGRPLERELALVKVAGRGEKRIEALRIAEIFRAKVIDTSTEHFVFELTGAHQQDRAVHLHHDGAGPGRGLPHRHRRHLPRAEGDVGVRPCGSDPMAAGNRQLAVAGVAALIGLPAIAHCLLPTASLLCYSHSLARSMDARMADDIASHRDFFISRADADKGVAKLVAQILRAAGFTTWLQDRELRLRQQHDAHGAGLVGERAADLPPVGCLPEVRSLQEGVRGRAS